MNPIKAIFVTAIITVLSTSLFAQQESMYTHYTYNLLTVNPACAGNRKVISVTGLHRSQWLGFTQRGKGAFETQTINIHAPITTKGLGLGVSLVNDRIFPINSTSIKTDLSYTINIDKDEQLSFGVKVSLNNKQGNLSAIALENTQEIDPAFQGSFTSILLLNFGTGLYYKYKHFYSGVSVTNLLTNQTYQTRIDESRLALSQKHFYLISGTHLSLSKNWDFKPSTFIKITSGAPVEMDLTGRFVYQQKLLIGASVRTGDALGILLGTTLFEHAEFGYSYDWSYSSRRSGMNPGSHEIVVRFDVHKREVILNRPKF